MAGTDWATSTGTAGNITAMTAYTTGDLGSLSSTSALKVQPTGPQTAVSSVKSFSTLNLTGTLGVAMSGAGALTFQSGGLIGNTTGVISGGTLEGSPGGDLAVITPRSLTIGSVIADNGIATGLTKAGSATLVLLGNNNYSGTTTIGAGTLQVGNGGSAGSLGPGPVVDNGALVFNLGNTWSFNGSISGNGSLTNAGSGRILLGGASSFVGGAAINQGTLQLASSTALFYATVAINSDNGLQFSPGIGTFYLGGLAGSNRLQLSNTAGTAVGIVVGGNGASTTFQRGNRRQRSYE